MSVQTQLRITDERMLFLPGYLKKIGVISMVREFHNAIGVYKQNIPGIKRGEKHFTLVQIMCACECFNISANFIFGFSDKIFRKPVAKKITTGSRIEKK